MARRGSDVKLHEPTEKENLRGRETGVRFQERAEGRVRDSNKPEETKVETPVCFRNSVLELGGQDFARISRSRQARRARLAAQEVSNEAREKGGFGFASSKKLRPFVRTAGASWLCPAIKLKWHHDRDSRGQAT